MTREAADGAREVGAERERQGLDCARRRREWRRAAAHEAGARNAEGGRGEAGRWRSQQRKRTRAGEWGPRAGARAVALRSSRGVGSVREGKLTNCDDWGCGSGTATDVKEGPRKRRAEGRVAEIGLVQKRRAGGGWGKRIIRGGGSVGRSKDAGGERGGAGSEEGGETLRAQAMEQGQRQQRWGSREQRPQRAEQEPERQEGRRRNGWSGRQSGGGSASTRGDCYLGAARAAAGAEAGDGEGKAATWRDGAGRAARVEGPGGVGRGGGRGVIARA